MLRLDSVSSAICLKVIIIIIIIIIIIKKFNRYSQHDKMQKYSTNKPYNEYS